MVKSTTLLLVVSVETPINMGYYIYTSVIKNDAFLTLPGLVGSIDDVSHAKKLI